MPAVPGGLTVGPPGRSGDPLLGVGLIHRWRRASVETGRRVSFFSEEGPDMELEGGH